MTMEAMEAILTRRSIRKYKSDHVSDEMVRDLLKAAMSAPMAANECWRFIVSRDKDKWKSFAKVHPHAHMLESCSVGIVICADPSVEKLKGRWPLDCAAATENILIAANSMGLGACWVGVYPVEERIQAVRDIFGAPDNIMGFSMVALGYPDEQKGPPDRFREEYIHTETW
jgi:nitroreductase